MTSTITTSELSEPVKLALDYLRSRFGYESDTVLGKGTYGSVVKVIGPDTGQLAAKFVERRMLNEMEVIIWPKLQHRNILKLVDAICDMHDVIIFLTELMGPNLLMRLQDKEFRADPNVLDRCRHYAVEVFNGMAYLHHSNLCHLDLRAENVFLSADDDRAVVADFSGLSWAEKEKRFCPLPRSLRPPEMLSPAKKRVEPLPVDLWACGLLLANMFLGKGFYKSTVKHSRAGSVEAVRQYTGLFQCEVYVRKFLDETYSPCTLTQNSIKNFMNIVHRFLQINPKNRLQVDQALSHPFLVSTNFARMKESDNFDKGKHDLPLTVQGILDKSAMDGVGTSERFEVIIPGDLEEGQESTNVDKNITASQKVLKPSRWKKCKRRFSVLKLPFRSAPILKCMKFKQGSKKKKSEGSEKLKSDSANGP